MIGTMSGKIRGGNGKSDRIKIYVFYDGRFELTDPENVHIVMKFRYCWFWMEK